MIISTKGRYALRIMIDLAIIKKNGEVKGYCHAAGDF